MNENQRDFFRVMAGAKSAYADLCLSQGFIGGDWGINEDLSDRLPDSRGEFNAIFVPIYTAANPEKSKISAGLACGMLHTICKGIRLGDIVLMPTGAGDYKIGEVTSEYLFASGESLPHRRSVKWREETVQRTEMSEELRNSSGSIGTVSNISKHAQELEALLAGMPNRTLIHTDETVEDPSAFALEKHLEDFLVANWSSTELSKSFNIFEEDGELGKQFPTDDGGYIDLLCVSKDEATLLVIELKKGRATDVVVGQIQRYMGFVKEKLAKPNQEVRGIIIALKDDVRLRRALSVAEGIEFYRYKVSFQLISQESH